MGDAEDVLADREAGDARPDGLDGSCEIAADARVLRRAGEHEADHQSAFAFGLDLVFDGLRRVRIA